MHSAQIGAFIPIVAIIMGIGIGMLAIWSDHKRKAQLLEQLHRERLQAIDKGLELPPLPGNLVGGGEPSGTGSAAKSLRSGVGLLLLGIILWLAIGEVGSDKAAWFGLIPAAFGVANLLYAAILWNKEKIR